jgi:putative transposase
MIARLARENGWGYTRIKGELAKLRMHPSRSTIVNVLKENGFDIGPPRSEGTWSEFLKRHADTLWACDFFSKKVVTAFGVVEFFVLFFIHAGSRRVHIAGMSTNPDAAWVARKHGTSSCFSASNRTNRLICFATTMASSARCSTLCSRPKESRSRRSARALRT